MEAQLEELRIAAHITQDTLRTDQEIGEVCNGDELCHGFRPCRIAITIADEALVATPSF